MEAMMSTQRDNSNEFTVQALQKLSINCPEKYVALLRATPANRTIEGMRPWAFAHDPQSLVEVFSSAVGWPVLPFAQAIGEDMMVGFRTEASQNPAVTVFNPWAQDKAHVVLAELPDFDAWLVYAAEFSNEFLAREAEAEDE